MAQHLLYNEIDLNADSLEFIKNNFKGLAKEAEWQQLKNYLIFLAENNSLKLCGAFSGNILINLALLIADQKQLSLLGLVNNENFKHENGSSFLIDRILQQYVGQQSFNFMGSNIRGIEVFFKSFGAELREYNFIENKFLKRFI
uniref:GNAT family N-acetyltransferase n=2 Tax=Chryseobacterium TaxID=59732 RepID=A0AAU6WKK4_9FLAO